MLQQVRDRVAGSDLPFALKPGFGCQLGSLLGEKAHLMVKPAAKFLGGAEPRLHE
jgi:hypothetical protein